MALMLTGDAAVRALQETGDSRLYRFLMFGYATGQDLVDYDQAKTLFRAGALPEPPPIPEPAETMEESLKAIAEALTAEPDLDWVAAAAEEIAGDPTCCDISSSDVGRIAEVIAKHFNGRRA